MTHLDLDHLEGLALMLDKDGRPWTTSTNVKGYPQEVYRSGDMALIAQCLDGPEVFPPMTADYISTFDPPTVLALIERLRVAESG